MITYKSRWGDKELRDFSGSNTLYEIVKYYGGYLWYFQNENQDIVAYNAYYYHNKDKMKHKFINTANADAKRYFSRRSISGCKMRRILITGAKHSVKSYEWLSEYVDYILKQCMENEFLRDNTLHIIYDSCNNCENQTNLDEWRIMCVKRLLGFQYKLLNNVSGRNVKASKSAKKNMDALENSAFVTEIIRQCSITTSNNTNIMV
jgi:hypothetical protein